MKYTQVKTGAFKELALNAGIIVDGDGFAPGTGAVTEGSIVCATSGGTTFTVTPSFKDYADDVDNAPKNLKEFKKMEQLEAKLAGTSITFEPTWVQKVLGSATLTVNNASGELAYSKITPKDQLIDSAFQTLWFICDYSDVNEDGGTTEAPIKAGFIAIKLNNALNTKGFELKSSDKNKATGSFEFLCHYSNAESAPEPFEIYIYAPSSAAEEDDEEDENPEQI